MYTFNCPNTLIYFCSAQLWDVLDLNVQRSTLMTVSGKKERNGRVKGSSVMAWVDSYSTAHTFLLQTLLVGDTVKGWVVAVQGL